MSIVRGNAGSRQRELAQAVLFLDTVFQSLSATFTGDRKLWRYCMEALMQHLTAWVRASLDDPDQRAAMLNLIQGLSACESGVFRQPISGLLVSPAFSLDSAFDRSISGLDFLFKASGIGREFSLEGMLDSFTQRKNVTVNLAV